MSLRFLAESLQHLSTYKEFVTTNSELTQNEKLIALYFCGKDAIRLSLKQSEIDTILTIVHNWNSSPLVLRILIKEVLARLKERFERDEELRKDFEKKSLREV